LRLTVPKAYGKMLGSLPRIITLFYADD
jgi:hypothetical protein